MRWCTRYWMTLDYAIDEGQLLSRNPAARTEFPPLRAARSRRWAGSCSRAIRRVPRGRSIPVPQRLMPILADRVCGRPPRAPAITSPNGALLGLQNWKRSTGWQTAIVEIGRPKMRVHGLRHTYASLARRAGADLRLLQKTRGHASITVTAHHSPTFTTTNSMSWCRRSTRSTTARLSDPRV